MTPQGMQPCSPWACLGDGFLYSTAQLASDEFKWILIKTIKAHKMGMVHHCCLSTAKPDSVLVLVLVSEGGYPVGSGEGWK